MISVVYTTLPTKEAALEIGKSLLEMNLIACTNIQAITSQYVWKGKYCEDQEYGLYIKTCRSHTPSVIKYINNNHPYDIPYIQTQEHTINNTYKTWMDSFLMYSGS
jgi:periplasmic divalent cation tolerance protein